MLLLVLGLPIAAFIVFEGGSSFLLFAYDLIAASRTGRAAQQLHTTYDAELGWASRKSFAAADVYAPGVGLHTNSRGFRGASDVADSLPAGGRRLVCSGDSFTFGQGVRDPETWCSLLGESGFESVNMGQIGYGIDQAYLWYMRDARNLQHTVQVLAFVTDDFGRMSADRFLGYAKPKLVPRGDSLVVEGVPTPRDVGVGPASRVKRVVQSLRASQLFGRLTPSASAPAPRDAQSSRAPLREITARLIAALKRANEAKGSRLVLVYLPIERDFVNDASRQWRDNMRVIADSLHVPLVDLVPVLRQVPPDSVPKLYIQQSGAVFEGMGHFTVLGNQWVAAHLGGVLDSLGLRPVTSPNGSVPAQRP